MSKTTWVLIAVACGTFMSTLDASIVNIALPTLTSEMAVSLFQVKWVVIAYFLIITCLLLPFGRLADQLGRKKVFGLGYFVFTVGSAACAAASGLTELVGARVLQGIGGAMIMANGPAVVTAVVPGNQRGKALGILAMVVSAGLISGPSLGGFLITHLGWRSIFFVNIPIGLIGFLLVNQFVPSELQQKTKRKFDWLGAVVQALVLVALFIAFDLPGLGIKYFSGGRLISAQVALCVFAVLCGIWFFKIEKKHQYPLFDLTLLKNRTFWTANLSGFLVFVAYSSFALLMPFYLERTLSFPTDKVGLFMTAIPLVILISAPISGRMSDRFGSQELSFSGALVLSLVLFASSGLFGGGLTGHSESFALISSLCLVGLGMGLFQSPNNNAIMGSVPREKLGSASALLATVRNLGLVVGTGLATAVFAWKNETTGNFMVSLQFSFLVAGVIAVLAMIASLGKRRGPYWGNR